MVEMAIISESPYKGSAQITREPFLFYEMRTTAKLMCEGLDDNEVIQRIVDENLFQYPTEKSIKQMAKTCINRLRAMGIGFDDDVYTTKYAGELMLRLLSKRK